MASYKINFVHKGRNRTKRAKSEESAKEIANKLGLSVYKLNDWWCFVI